MRATENCCFDLLNPELFNHWLANLAFAESNALIFKIDNEEMATKQTARASVTIIY